MDANAYLRKQGWKGSGHSLDNSGRGIKKPLLISHKYDQLGIGKKKAAHNTDDQWWMRAFDESLKSIGSGKESTLSQIRSKGINRGGLYGFFVKGEGLTGTVSNTEDSSAAEASDTSTPPPVSGNGTPPTSASESESTSTSADDGDTATKNATMANKDNKRKRGNYQDTAASKRLKRERKVIKRKMRKDAKNARKQTKKIDAAEQREVTKQTVDEAGLVQKRETMSNKLSKLTPQKKVEYEQRAASKNQTLEEYILRRTEKKVAKRTARTAEKATKERADASSDAMFFADLSSDKSLLTKAPLVYTPLEDGTCPIDPIIWEGREVKSLPKEVLEARRKHLENRRNKRKLRAGKVASENISRSERKLHTIDAMTRELLEKERYEKGAASKELKSTMRRKAKKQYKLDKQEKYGKAGKEKLAHNTRSGQRVSQKAKSKAPQATAGGASVVTAS